MNNNTRSLKTHFNQVQIEEKNSFVQLTSFEFVFNTPVCLRKARGMLVAPAGGGGGGFVYGLQSYT